MRVGLENAARSLGRGIPRMGISLSSPAQKKAKAL
jgi:hypothetical protein